MAVTKMVMPAKGDGSGEDNGESDEEVDGKNREEGNEVFNSVNGGGGERDLYGEEDAPMMKEVVAKGCC